MHKKVTIVINDTKNTSANYQTSKIHNDKKLVFDHWHGKEKCACKCIVGSLVKNNIQHCFINNKKIGTFNGYEKMAVSYCDDVCITLSYDDFMNSVLPYKVHDALFIIDEHLYDIQGNKMTRGYEKRYSMKQADPLQKNKFSFPFLPLVAHLMPWHKMN